MDRKKIWNIVRNFFCSGFVFYIGIALLVLLCVDRVKLVAHAGPTTLSRLRPNYLSIGNMAAGRNPLNQRTLEEMRGYLKNVNLVMGERADTDLFLGYCLFYLNDHKQAEKYFLFAIEHSPSFFWSYHGAAILAIRQGQEFRAEPLLQAAENLSPDAAMQAMLNSRIFLPLILEGGFSPQVLFQRLMAGRLEIYKLLCQQTLKSGHFALTVETAQNGLKFSEKDSDRTEFLYYIGAASMRSGSISQATKVFEECLKIDANYPEALLDMAFILKNAGQEQFADGLIQRARDVMQKRGSSLLDGKKVQIRAF